MCDNSGVGTLTLIVLIANFAFRNVLQLWPATVVLSGLSALTALVGKGLQLGLFGVPGVVICTNANAQTAYTWLLGISVMLLAANVLYSFGAVRSKPR